MKIQIKCLGFGQIDLDGEIELTHIKDNQYMINDVFKIELTEDQIEDMKTRLFNWPERA